jgi:hypothetical protein
LKKTVLNIGSATLTMKIRRILSREGIEYEIVKTSPEKGANGCSHGIEISSEDMYTAARLLRDAGISYTVSQGEK